MTVLSNTREPVQEKFPEYLLELDPTLCAARIGRGPMLLQHSLDDHPLLTLEALAALADSLSVETIECLTAAQQMVSPGGQPLPLPRPSETVLDIETNGRWMVMKNIEQNPLYGRLLDELLDLVAPLLPAREGRMGVREGFMFLSAPNSVTPVHIDPEHNILLHVRGTKEFSVGKFDRRTNEQREIRRYLQGGHRNLAESPSDFNVIKLEPGDGLYVPPWRPHWVKNGPTYAISLSIAFRTWRSERYEYTHMVNGKLERIGLSPRPAGESDRLDAFKASYVRGKRWLRYGGRQGASRNYSWR